MADRTITRQEYLQLEGLIALSNRHVRVVEQCSSAMNEMLGTKDDDAVADVIYGDRNAAWLLDRHHITIEEQ